MAEAGDVVYEAYDSDDDVFLRHRDHDHPQGSSLSRLSSMYSAAGDVEEEGVFDGTRMSLSRLSIESCFDADDEEEEEEEEQPPGGGGKVVKGRRGLDLDMLVTSSDSEKDDQPGGGSYSLPATPTRRRRSSQVGGMDMNRKLVGAKGYESENEAHKGLVKEGASSRKARRRRAGSQRWLGGDGGSDHGGGGGSELVVITRPKGGRRSLCMDLEEVKACRDLGFELEHERMVEVPASRVSFSGSTLDTSSGGNSPIANWRISSSGDDPRDVKARLKVWAQAVAIASTSRYGGI